MFNVLEYRDLILAYGWVLLPALAIVSGCVIGVKRWRRSVRLAARDQRRTRNIARQRAWDWLMRRSGTRRLTYRPGEDQI